MWLWLFHLLFKTFWLQTVWLFNVHTFDQFMSSFGQMRKTKWSNNIFNKYRLSSSFYVSAKCLGYLYVVYMVYDSIEFRYLSDWSCCSSTQRNCVTWNWKRVWLNTDIRTPKTLEIKALENWRFLMRFYLVHYASIV